MLILGLGGYDIVDPDGPRFALVAKEMLSTHQWVMPHRNEYSYPDKPPLFFWCIAFFSYFASEVNSFTARTPSVLAAIGILFYLFKWVKKNPENKEDFSLAVFTSFILLTSFLFFYEARMTQIDMLLSFFVTAAMIEGYYLVSENKTNVWPMAIYMGLGTITKGPIAFLLPIGACATFMVLNKVTWSKLPWKSLLLSFLIPLTWITFLLIEVIKSNEWAYFQNLLFKQTITRYANSWHHEQPFYYFLITFIYDFFPWSPFFLLALIFPLKKWNSISNKEKFAWSVCLFVMIFFSIPRGKRNLYILPLFPFAAYIVAVSLHFYFKAIEIPRFFKWTFRFLFTLFLLSSIGLMMIGLKWYKIPKAEMLNIQIPYMMVFNFGASLLLISLSGFLALKKGSIKFPSAILILLMIQVNLFTFQILLPTLDKHRSLRGFMQEIIAITERDDNKPILGMVDFKEGCRLYGNHHIIELDNSKGESKNGEYGVEKFWELFPSGWLIIRKSSWDDYVKAKSIKGILVYEQALSYNKIYYLIRKGI